MFSFSAARDAEYAIGWPHLCSLDRERDDDAAEVARANELLMSVDPPWIAGRSRVMCTAYVRGVDVTPRGDRGAGLVARTSPLDDDELDRWSDVLLDAGEVPSRTGLSCAVQTDAHMCAVNGALSVAWWLVSQSENESEYVCGDGRS